MAASDERVVDSPGSVRGNSLQRREDECAAVEAITRGLLRAIALLLRACAASGGHEQTLEAGASLAAVLAWASGRPTAVPSASVRTAAVTRRSPSWCAR